MTRESHRSVTSRIAPALLSWYGRARRDLPWRMPPGLLGDPYLVWLSEVMLQQTTVKAVLPYFARFIERWPNIEALAAAPRDDVLSLWAGLGYYSRANNLHACAQIVANEFGGAFPQDERTLLRLPGIGPYTAAAISAMAFGHKATPVDGNIERVMSRLFAIEEPLPESKSALRTLAESATPERDAGDFAQALMDLGATVCTPRRPSCLICPLEDLCAANARGIAARLPVKAEKQARPIRYGAAFLALREDGCILLRKRPSGGLLSNMTEIPSSEWSEHAENPSSRLKTVPVRARWWRTPGSVSHTFTHFRLEMMVYRALVDRDASLTLWAEQQRCRWVPRNALDEEALPSVMRKIIAHGFDAVEAD